MYTKEELLKDMQELVGGGVLTEEEGNQYEALLGQEEPLEVVKKLYLALQEKNETISYFNEKCELGSLSMRSVKIG